MPTDTSKINAGAQDAADPVIEEMLKAGVHIGHSRTKRNPAMDPYIFGLRNNIQVVDLAATKELLEKALVFIGDLCSKDKIILLVGTGPSAKGIIEEAGAQTNMPRVTGRWIGGTLTNFKTILARIQTMEKLEEEKSSGEFEKYTKKEKMMREKEIASLKKNFEGLRLLKKLPDAVFVADTIHDNLAVREANRVKIPVIALCDTNSDPRPVAYVIPSNDNALSAVKYMVNRIKEAILEGKKKIGKKEE